MRAMTGDRDSDRVAPGRRFPTWLTISIAGAAVLSLALIAGLQYHKQRQLRAEGELAKQQTVLALRIAAQELHFAQEKVQKLHTVW